MASRQEEKKRLREHREEAEREAAAGARRRLVAGYAVAAVLSAAVIAGVLLVVAGSGGSSSAQADAPFGEHYDGLDARRMAAGVTTMRTPDGATHIHPQLAVYVDGKQVEVPANIGIDPANSPAEMAGLHAHDAKGTIHDEGMAGAQLGQFFAIWGVPFSKDRLGPSRASGSKTVRMWVDGTPSDAFGDLILKDGQQIVVAYGPKDAPPPPGPR